MIYFLLAHPLWTGLICWFIVSVAASFYFGRLLKCEGDNRHV